MSRVLFGVFGARTCQHRWVTSTGLSISCPPRVLEYLCEKLAALLSALAAGALAGCLSTATGPVSAPPSDCAYKFVGMWTVQTNSGQTYQAEIRPDGTSTAYCPLCMPVQRWTCHGDTRTVLDPFVFEDRLSADGMRLDSAYGSATRNGPPPSAPTPVPATALAAAAPPTPTRQVAQTQVAAATRPASAPSTGGCPAGFYWEGGYLCAARDLSPADCARMGGNFVDLKIAGAPARCEVVMAAADAAPSGGAGARPPARHSARCSPPPAQRSRAAIATPISAACRTSSGISLRNAPIGRAR